ncbi:hypothetical protein L596_001127 [Steinernema carpocapsae]|uniref:Uncharacterized protein n=1 Tax=Steinernema carpocapsae TaxID=34508 RepID=A0A4U8ULE0_STECR|nr:hypothetical protein L596_001127 [Steinernema carpocapsae]
MLPNGADGVSCRSNHFSHQRRRSARWACVVDLRVAVKLPDRYFIFRLRVKGQMRGGAALSFYFDQFIACGRRRSQGLETSSIYVLKLF